MQPANRNVWWMVILQVAVALHRVPDDKEFTLVGSQPLACPQNVEVEDYFLGYGNNDVLGPIGDLCASDFNEKFFHSLLSEGKTSDAGGRTTDHCAMAIVTINDPGYPQYATRAENIANMLELNSTIKTFHAPWASTHWSETRRFYAALEIPKCNYWSFGHAGCDLTLHKGQLGRWLSIIMATAYLLASPHPCLWLFEDDVKLSDGLNDAVKSVTISENAPELIRIGAWGEGYVFNREWVAQYHETIYSRGIWAESDTFINHLLPVFVQRTDNISWELLVQGNAGGIAREVPPGHYLDDADFQYVSNTSGSMDALVQAFHRAADPTDFVSVLHDFLGRILNVN